MKIKHISMIVLLWMMTIQATAQQVKWMNPMDGDEPYICGRAWNKEMGKSYDRLPERFAATLPKNVWSLKAQTAGVIVRFVSNSKTIRVRYGCPSNNYNGFNMTGINKSGVDLYGKTPDGDTHWIANHMSWKMKADTARVTNQGINKFGTLYTDYELCHYVGKHVGIKWDIDDVTKLYVFDQEGRKICEAVSAELLAFGPHCSQAALERHLRDQKRQEKEMREILDSMTRPYELRVQEGGRPSEAVGMIDLTIKADRPSKLISLPNDKEFRAEMATNRKTGKKASGDEFLGKKADDALARLRAMNE